MLRTGWSEHLASASSEEAQLALSLIVWPEVAPLPKVVDEWLRRQREKQPDRDEIQPSR